MAKVHKYFVISIQNYQISELDGISGGNQLQDFRWFWPMRKQLAWTCWSVPKTFHINTQTLKHATAKKANANQPKQLSSVGRWTFGISGACGRMMLFNFTKLCIHSSTVSSTTLCEVFVVLCSMRRTLYKQWTCLLAPTTPFSSSARIVAQHRPHIVSSAMQCRSSRVYQSCHSF